VIEPAGLYRSLYRTWLEMETLRGRGCGEGILSGEICAGRFEPDWLRPPGSFTPTLAEVTAWADELQSEVMIVTMPICAIPPLDLDGPGACSVE
jgi:hypothetical protein